MKALRSILIALLGLTGLFLAGEVGARAYLTSQMNERVSAATGASLEVSVAGFPVLFQLVSGRLNEVSFSLNNLTANGVRISEARGTAYDVGISRPYTARELHATAKLSTADLNAFYRSLPLSAGSLSTTNNRIQLSAELLGTPIGVTFTPHVNGNSIALRPAEVIVAGNTVEISSFVGFLGPLGEPIQLPFRLPAGVQLTNVAVTNAGLQVWARGSQVELGNLK